MALPKEDVIMGLSTKRAIDSTFARVLDVDDKGELVVVC